jgi:uncharacterized protein (TIGR02594 family)
MAIGSALVGAGERPNRSQIKEYLKNGGVNLDPVTTAWCAAYVNSTLAQAGYQGTGSNMARSFLNYGQKVDQPQKGDLAVFQRGDPNGPFGHVGFFDGLNPDGTIRVLGGNQKDAVNYSNYGADKLLGYRRPVKAGEAPAAPSIANMYAPEAPKGGPTIANAAALAQPALPGGPMGAPVLGAEQPVMPAQQNLGQMAALFAQQQSKKNEQRAAEEAAEQTRRAALFSQDSLAGLFGA